MTSPYPRSIIFCLLIISSIFYISLAEAVEAGSNAEFDGQDSVLLGNPANDNKKSNILKNSPSTNERHYLRYQDLNSEEREIISRGEISDTRYILGGVLGTYPFGLGIGHAVQGRYSEKGWIFTAGELASFAVVVAGLGRCESTIRWNNSFAGCDGTLLFVGISGFLVFRIWEIIDVWATPPEINRKYKRLKEMLGPNFRNFETQIIPLLNGNGAQLALQWQF